MRRLLMEELIAEEKTLGGEVLEVQVPFPVHSPHGNPQHLGCLCSSKAGEEPQLNKPDLAVVDSRQHHKSFIESNIICAAVRHFVCRRE